MPPVPYFTLGDYALYSNLIACLLVLLASTVLYKYAAGVEKDVTQWDEDTTRRFTQGFMIVTILFLFVPYLIVAFLTMKHYCYWQGKYDNRDN